MAKTQRRTRLMDVAGHAGVSTATVSRVLNGRPEVSAETRRDVLAALDRLGYERPERLRTREAGLVGIVLPELTNPVFPAFAQSIESALSGAGYTPVLCAQSPNGTMEDEYVEMLLAHEVDGIVFVSGTHADSKAPADRYARLRTRGLPLVLVNGSDGRIDAPAFAIDDTAAMDVAVRHLVAQGHRHIGLAIGPERFIPSQRKREGFMGAVARHLGVTSPAVIATLYTLEGGQGAAATLIDAGCTAVICGSDLMALGAVRAARSLGLSVPEDFSVIGYDDSPLMAFTDPPLTTLRQPIEAMSKTAVEALVAEINGEGGPRAELLFMAELIVRGSTAVAPGVTSIDERNGARASRSLTTAGA